MLYLLSQMSVALICAIVGGIALGWILHRHRVNSEADELRAVIERQQRKLSQAQTDIKLLSDDFDDLTRRHREESAALIDENRALPELRQNLERSQLLVRQTMAQHESEQASLLGEIDALKARLKSLAASDSARARALEDAASARDDEAAGIPHRQANEPATEESPAGVRITDTPPANETPANEPPANESLADEVSADERRADERTTGGETASGTASREVTVEVTTDDMSPASIALPDRSATDMTAMHVAMPDASPTTDDRRGWASRPTPDVSVRPTGRDRMRPPSDGERLDVDDEDEDDDLMFEPVDQIDDLQQIVGIGAFTERALNRLGITSYSQLAELKEHDIERLADALEIGPSRIRRDDWVGAARRQLEDVLEDL